MNTIKINIQLDPVKDGVGIIPGRVIRQCKKALIIGTNGEYRLADEEEAYDIIDRLSANSTSDYMGKTNFLVIYNAKKVLAVSGSQYIAGSFIIVKGTAKGIELLNDEEVEDAKNEFMSRLAVLCGSGIQFSAYEID